MGRFAGLNSLFGLKVIGALKLFKGVFFLALGIGLLRLLHSDIDAFALSVVQALHLDPDRRFISKLLDEASLLTAYRLKLVSIVVFLYSALDFVEGVGLLLAQRWAEYVTLVFTLALLPLEAYKLIRHPNHWTAIIFAVNIVIALYLIWLVRNQHRERAGASRQESST
jgi:uncharacterized membrane protein (DUF2068 family)